MGSVTAFPLNPSGRLARSDATPSRHRATEFEIDEDRHRNRVNLLGAIVGVLLIAAGWWIVNSLAETQRAQSCYATGNYCSLMSIGAQILQAE
jgi:hypothetical protein